MSLSYYETALRQKIEQAKLSKISQPDPLPNKACAQRSTATQLSVPVPTRETAGLTISMHHIGTRWSRCFGVVCEYFKPGPVPLCLSTNQAVTTLFATDGQCPEKLWRIMNNAPTKHPGRCRVCSSNRFWRRKNQSRWTCVVCHPPQIDRALCEFKDHSL